MSQRSEGEEEEFYDALSDHDEQTVEPSLSVNLKRLSLSDNSAVEPVTEKRVPPPLPPRPPPTVESTVSLFGPDPARSAELTVTAHQGEAPASGGGLSRTASQAGLHPLAEIQPEGDDASSLHSLESMQSMGSSSTVASSFTSPSLLSTAHASLKRVRVKTHRKTRTDFDPLFQIQELGTTTNSPSSGGVGHDSARAVFAMAFSPDGHWLAVAGAEGVIRLWRVLAAEAAAVMAADPHWEPPRLAAIFATEPHRTWQAHEVQEGEGEAQDSSAKKVCGEAKGVLDLSWSRNLGGQGSLLLSAGMDGNARLWHPERPDCLAVFPHGDWVTGVCFHTRDDRLFVTGCLDGRIRLWSIATRSVQSWVELPPGNPITAVGIGPRARFVLAGTAGGTTVLLDLEAGLRYVTQVLVHSRRGKNSKGSKICGFSYHPVSGADEINVLISTNDSRLRVYTSRDKSQTAKFLGHQNTSSQIKASFSEDAEWVVSGSEDGCVYLWSVEGRHSSFRLFGNRNRNKSWERFPVGRLPVTCAILAPSCLHPRLQSCGLRPISLMTPHDHDGHDGGDQSHAHGRIIVCGDIEGRVRVYECNPQLEAWLSHSQP